MLRIEELKASYNKETVIDKLSYTFEDGIKYGIIGTSGIGKTTLLNLIAGLKKPSAGKILSSNERISYIFQEPRLFPWLTALENVKLVCKDENKAALLLDRLMTDITAKSKYPSELSGGMKQRVAIARALCHDGDLILMDEPFKGLDAELRQEVSELVFEYSKNKTVILVTHDTSDLVFCDKILKMEGTPVSSLKEAESGSLKIE